MQYAEPVPTPEPLRLEDLSELTEIGRGAAAAVYRCARPDGRPAAVKLFNAVAADDAAAEQYRRERAALDRLPRHPAIVALEGRGRARDGRPFLLLELTERSLRAAVDEHGPMPWRHAVLMGITLAGALETAHRAGVVHCDVAPGNVHHSDGRWKLADFGASCTGPAEEGEPDRPFTLDHAPPEAIRGEPADPTRDVYGLVSTLFFALAARAPFGEVRADPPEEVAARIATEPAPDLRPLGVPDALGRVIERGLSKSPGRRPAGAAELAAELCGAADLLGLAVTPPLVLAPVTAELTTVPGTGEGEGSPGPPGAVGPSEATGGRFVPVLVGVAAAALAVGAAVPVIADAMDSGPSSLLLAQQPAEVAAGPIDEDAGAVSGEDNVGVDDADGTDEDEPQEAAGDPGDDGPGAAPGNGAAPGDRPSRAGRRGRAAPAGANAAATGSEPPASAVAVTGAAAPTGGGNAAGDPTPGPAGSPANGGGGNEGGGNEGGGNEGGGGPDGGGGGGNNGPGNGRRGPGTGDPGADNGPGIGGAAGDNGPGGPGGPAA